MHYGGGFFFRVCVRVLIAYCDDGKSGFGWDVKGRSILVIGKWYIYAWMNE